MKTEKRGTGRHTFPFKEGEKNRKGVGKKRRGGQQPTKRPRVEVCRRSLSTPPDAVLKKRKKK